jgi:GTPase SAR1 family protein
VYSLLISEASLHDIDLYTTAENTDQEEADREKMLGRANVVCIVYDISDPKTIESITTRWIPSVSSNDTGSQLSRPIILVGNKLDKSNFENSAQQHNPIKEILKKVRRFSKIKWDILLTFSSLFVSVY